MRTAAEASVSQGRISRIDALAAALRDSGCMPYTGKLEYAHHRKIRERNTLRYRFAHWPLWITVFFLAPGPLIFSLFAHGFGRGNAIWLALVLLGTGIAGLRAQLPGVELRPYILRFDEDKPNPLYRRVCYTFAWNAAVNFALMNLIGLTIAAVTGVWYMSQIYHYAYLPVLALILLLGIAGLLPRVGRSTKGEGTERRFFYGTVWAVTIAQTVLLVLWKTMPQNQTTSQIKLGVYATVLLLMGIATYQGKLPRTRPIVAGELMVD